MRTTVVAALLACLALATSACGGDDESALQGMYTLASWTANPDGCDAEGPPSFEAGQYSHFFVRQDEFFGETFVSAVMCDDLEACRTDAADTDTLFLGGFTFEGGDDEAGWTGSTGYLGGENCDGEVHLTRLTGEPGTSVTMRRETRPVTGVARDDEGDCDLDAAFAEAEDQPCEQLAVVTGAYLEGL